jgi:hypothetical protein
VKLANEMQTVAVARSEECSIYPDRNNTKTLDVNEDTQTRSRDLKKRLQNMKEKYYIVKGMGKILL